MPSCTHSVIPNTLLFCNFLTTLFSQWLADLTLVQCSIWLIYSVICNLKLGDDSKSPTLLDIVRHNTELSQLMGGSNVWGFERVKLIQLYWHICQLPPFVRQMFGFGICLNSNATNNIASKLYISTCLNNSTLLCGNIP